MSRLILSARARRDLEDIWRFTAAHWNVEQADAYVVSITAALQLLAEGRHASQVAEELERKYRRSLIGSHMAYFRVDSSRNVRVVRILHQSMSIHRHLR